MDKKDLLKLKNGIAILVVGIIVFAAIIAKVVPQIQKIPTTQKEIQTQTKTLEDTKRQLADLKAAEEKNKNKTEEVLKAFFVPEEAGLDGEAAIAMEFSEISDSLKQNKIKTRSIKYDYDPADDNFVRNMGAKYHACRIDMELIGNYRSLENFLRDLYKHPHFLEISKIEVAPYQKDKRILLTNLQIKIYTQKDGGGNTESKPPMDTSAQTPQT